tara:strand:- start:1343 stop:2185 length:843 start_codon:yes stop_codon:yes gene_type:complete
MTETHPKSFKPDIIDSLDNQPGLTINDLNRYLPAMQTSEDIQMKKDKLQEGLFFTDGLDGLKKIPDRSIDLIITEPPRDPWLSIDKRGSQMTLQEYYEWNQNWISEAHRILKITGAIYLICDWHSSNMYFGLLSDQFIIQNRITWQNSNAKNKSKTPTWKNQSGDIWFVTKSDDFLFNSHAVSLQSDREGLIQDREKKFQTNFWMDIPKANDQNSRISNKLYLKLLEASSFKLNWVLDPFMRNGDVGLNSKKLGRRFIGFEANKDLLLLSMKRIDQRMEE